MKTIAGQVIETMAGKNLEFLGFSHCWDFYTNSFGNKSKISRDVVDQFKNNPDLQEITVIVGARGQSQHSKTELLMFDSSSKKSVLNLVDTHHRYFYIFKR